MFRCFRHCDHAGIIGSYLLCSGVSGTVEPTTLSIEQSPQHAHKLYGQDMGDDIVSRIGNCFFYTAVNYDSSSRRNIGNMSDLVLNAGGSQSHTHILDGSTGDKNSLPPYYSLSLIMRVS